MLIKAALNGSRGRHEHDALPLSPASLARDAARVRAAGAEDVDVHPRDRFRRETLEAEHCADTLDAIRASAPGFGPSAWPLLKDAITRGYDVRIGLEDTLLMADGSPAKGNVALVSAAATLVSARA